MTHATKGYQTVIFQTKDIDEKIYIREQKGHFQQIRRLLSWLLMFIFIIGPFIQFNGQQAIYIDVEHQKITLFSLTLFPQDLLVVGLVFILSAFILFYVTRLYGRIWCGYTCPQTIWMLMFNWLERRVEGTHHQSKALDKMGFTAKKLIKKTIKHSLWLSVSLLTGLIFISYFVPANTLYKDFFTFNSSMLVQAWVYFFTFCTYLNGGWIKEKMCLHICPYARFQSVMFQADTKLVTYNAERGESRGPRKIKAEKPAEKGDCVDCGLCVDVCPVGIDIRHGLQYECINCGLCIDACNDVMSKFNYAKNLIQYRWQQAPKQRWKQHLSYGLLCFFTVCSLFFWALCRDNVDVKILRDRQALYRINPQGHAENTYTIKIINKTQSVKNYFLVVHLPRQVVIKGKTQFQIKAGEQLTNTIAVASLEKITAKHVPITFNLTEQESQTTTVHQSTFYSGDDVW